jgi:hypothetical protein
MPFPQLMILVAADLIRTVAVAPSLHNVAALGVVVLIRTFLSFSLQVEIEGVAPCLGRRRGIALSGNSLRADHTTPLSHHQEPEP